MVGFEDESGKAVRRLSLHLLVAVCLLSGAAVVTIIHIADEAAVDSINIHLVVVETFGDVAEEEAISIAEEAGEDSIAVEVEAEEISLKVMAISKEEEGIVVVIFEVVAEVAEEISLVEIQISLMGIKSRPANFNRMSIGMGIKPLIEDTVHTMKTITAKPIRATTTNILKVGIPCKSVMKAITNTAVGHHHRPLRNGLNGN